MTTAQFTLPKHQRLTQRDDYKRVFNNRYRVRAKEFTSAVMRNKLPYARLGLAVSKRVSSKAIVRNRLKRIIRESFRHHCAHMGGIDVIVVALPGASSLDNSAVRDDLEYIWKLLERSCSE